MTLERLLHALADGRPHSVEDLAHKLGVASPAVPEQLAQLAELGLEVDVLPRATYRLRRRVDLLTHEALRAALEPDVAARVARLELFMQLDSTNRFLLATAPTAGMLDVCIAEFQTAGRGRRGKRWQAPLGSGICLSVGSRFAGMPAVPAAMTLAVGAAVRRVLERIAGLAISLKWPNDLVFDERKLGGILLEARPDAHGGAHLVAGIGLNVALPGALLPSLSDWPRGAIDLATALGAEPPPRAALAAALVNELAALFAGYPSQGFAAYRREWHAADFLRGRQVELDEAGGTVRGTAAGIDADGALLVEVERGKLQRVVAGNVSVRPHP